MRADAEERVWNSERTSDSRQQTRGKLNNISRFFTNRSTLLNGQIKEDQMGGTCRKHTLRSDISAHIQSENVKTQDHLGGRRQTLEYNIDMSVMVLGCYDVD
jgi:hypothetical protein